MFRAALELLVAASLLGCASQTLAPGECPAPATAGGDEQAVIEAVEAVFAAMRDHEVEALRARVVDGAVIVAMGEGQDVPRMISAEAFIAGTAGDTSVTIDERFTQTPRVRVDGDIASLWGFYEVFVAGELHHCGVDAVQLVRSASAWRVTAITYSARPCS